MITYVEFYVFMLKERKQILAVALRTAGATWTTVEDQPVRGRGGGANSDWKRKYTKKLYY